MIRRYLIYAGADGQIGANWPIDGSRDETTETGLRMAQLARDVRTALLEAKGNGGAALKARLQTIDAALPSVLERHGRPLTRTDIYLDAAELMTQGIRAYVSPGEGSGFGWPERAALRRHLALRFGSSLDIFVEHVKELTIQEKAWMSFAKAMAAIGRPNEAQWAIRQLDFKGPPQSSALGGCYSRAAAVMLGIGDFREADRIIGSAPCYAQRSEIAKLYALNGEPGKAKEIAYELLAGLPAYMQALTHILDGPSLGDTVQPLMTALFLAGDRERALTEMQEMVRFARNEGRHLVSFEGTSLGMAQLAQIYYEIGEDAKADALIETAIAEDSGEQRPSWSEPFALAYTKCASGKPDCLRALLGFSYETVDRGTGEQILSWAVKAGRPDITVDIIGEQFNIADVWLLNYGKLSLQVLAGDEDSAAQTLALLIDKESHHADPKPLLRCIFLLRLAVAMEKRDLAAEVAKIVLSRVFRGTPAEAPPGSDNVDWERWPANRTTMLAESAGVLAQLP
jgi:tetratricopeptide (TPR) repeat protein